MLTVEEINKENQLIKWVIARPPPKKKKVKKVIENKRKEFIDFIVKF